MTHFLSISHCKAPRGEQARVVQTVKPQQRPFGEEIKPASRCATRAACTINSTMATRQEDTRNIIARLKNYLPRVAAFNPSGESFGLVVVSTIKSRLIRDTREESLTVDKSVLNGV
ncbi:hypothetical protein KQX54_017672 [Cotesia glomerata]|uniref:Uncharacterized protein n=1 Tax=Cotesia glomerata TaxID=32391 RepID=A0AAV7ICW8_COTGL|nr:hypothetical protein KQX54_017672 [Cotesia glomerata]